jgi:hypothetical protein
MVNPQWTKKNSDFLHHPAIRHKAWFKQISPIDVHRAAVAIADDTDVFIGVFQTGLPQQGKIRKYGREGNIAGRILRTVAKEIDAVNILTQLLAGRPGYLNVHTMLYGSI